MSPSRSRLSDLLYRVEQQRRSLLVDTLAPWNLNLGQWTALHNLARSGSSTMTELAQASALDRTSLTRTIDNLVERGLVVRSTPPNDRRTVKVEATAQGRDLVDQASRETKAFEDQWLEAFDDATLDRLAGDLEKLSIRLAPPAKRSSPQR